MPEPQFNLINTLAVDKTSNPTIDLSGVVTKLEGVITSVTTLGGIVNEMRNTQAGWGDISEMTDNVGKIAKANPEVVSSLKEIKDNSKKW